jgi:hypothetical protein
VEARPNAPAFGGSAYVVRYPPSLRRAQAASKTTQVKPRAPSVLSSHSLSISAERSAKKEELQLLAWLGNVICKEGAMWSPSDDLTSAIIDAKLSAALVIPISPENEAKLHESRDHDDAADIMITADDMPSTSVASPDTPDPGVDVFNVIANTGPATIERYSDKYYIDGDVHETFQEAVAAMLEKCVPARAEELRRDWPHVLQLISSPLLTFRCGDLSSYGDGSHDDDDDVDIGTALPYGVTVRDVGFTPPPSISAMYWVDCPVVDHDRKYLLAHIRMPSIEPDALYSMFWMCGLPDTPITFVSKRARDVLNAVHAVHCAAPSSFPAGTSHLKTLAAVFADVAVKFRGDAPVDAAQQARLDAACAAACARHGPLMALPAGSVDAAITCDTTQLKKRIRLIRSMLRRHAAAAHALQSLKNFCISYGLQLSKQAGSTRRRADI